MGMTAYNLCHITFLKNIPGIGIWPYSSLSPFFPTSKISFFLPLLFIDFRFHLLSFYQLSCWWILRSPSKADPFSNSQSLSFATVTPSFSAQTTTTPAPCFKCSIPKSYTQSLCGFTLTSLQTLCAAFCTSANSSSKNETMSATTQIVLWCFH